MNANSPTAPRMLKAAEKRILALEYRTKGYSLQLIADKIDGLSVSGVSKTLKVALENLLTKQLESTDHLRTLELQRLDELWYTAYKQAITGINNLQAIDRCLKIMKRRAELLGLDAPVKSELSQSVLGDIKVTIVRNDKQSE